ncbi:MAG TPA: CHRD domain-containing protein [Burkholderiales bacterium]|nr:CHRD domain-containing protein [Burkholderiales bacterium]
MKQLPIVTVLVLAFAASPALADGGSKLQVRLSGYQEIPTLSSGGDAKFEARILGNVGSRRIPWKLSYNNGFSSPVTQAHIHFGARAFNGGISIFLCTNLGNGPAGTQMCPVGPVTISGEATAADVIGPAGQLIAAGEIEEIIAAIRAGVAYVNIHTTMFGPGEIRGQFAEDDHRHHDDDDDDD